MGTHVNLDVEVLQVERVLPDVHADDGDVGQEGVLVGGGDDLEDLGLGVVSLEAEEYALSFCARDTQSGGTHEPAPAGALDGRGGRVELLLEVVERAEGLRDGLLEGAVTESTTVALALGGRAREVLPEEGVVDVTCVAAVSPIASYRAKARVGYSPPPLNLSAAWRAMRSLGVEALA